MNLEHLQQVMAEIGPLTDSLLSVVQHGDTVWELAFDNDTAILAQHDAAGSKVTFTLETGPLPKDNLTAAYELMLAYNACWSETGGLRMAIDRPGGVAMLLLDLFAPDLDVSQLSTIIAGLLQKQGQWCEALNSLASGESAGDLPPTEQPGSLRV